MESLGRLWRQHPLRINDLFVVLGVFLVVCGIVAWQRGSSYRIDSMVGLLFTVWLFWKYKQVGIRSEGVPFLLLSVFMANAGLFGAYNLVFLKVGYDKWLHLVSGFAFTLALHQMISGKGFRGWRRWLVAFFLMLGLGALEEVAEFIGSVYFGVSEGFLAMQAGEAFYPVSDLVKYDPLWDMLFNVFGGLWTGLWVWWRK